MSTTTTCPDCGNALPSSALGGICPFCLASSVEEELESRTPVGEVVVGPSSYEQIGPYRILDRLGEGGYGVVYRAEQERPLRRMVAIKIMKGGVVNEQAVARFEAERQALAMMEHPSIAHVYDVGETNEGLPYFVMELIEGLPISTWCEENNLSREERLKLFQQVCEAVGHAHRRGIIHRDLKPSNILVTGVRGEVLPKVIDFGIAKATETLLTERTLVTRDHQLIGTPAYMSPEQAAMTGGDVDTRSDIYSLGVLLYELLTGTTPFRIEELAKLPYDEALRKVRTEDPQRPSSRCREVTRTGGIGEAQTAEFQVPVSTDLDWIVMKSLEKDPERRYETAGALSRDLGCYLEGEVIEARPPTAAYLASRFFRKHRIPVLAAAAVLLAMVAGTIVSLAMFFRAEDQAERALENERLAEEQAERAEDSDLRRMLRFSHADMAQATPLLDDGRPALAVAHLARALRTHPSYEAAATRLLYTVASENWARPHLTIPSGRYTRGMFAADGSRLLVFSSRGTTLVQPRVRIYDAETGEELHDLSLHDAGAPASEVPPDLRHLGNMSDVDLSPDGEKFAVLTIEGTVSQWDVETGKEVAPRFRLGPRGNAAHLRYSTDGELLACTQWEVGMAQVVNAETGELKASLKLPKAGKRVRGLAAFFDDGSRLVFGQGTLLQVFDIESGEGIGDPMEHDGAITGVAALPGGERVVSWSRDASARVWNVDTGEVELVLHHEDAIETGALSPDGSRLMTGTGQRVSEAGMVRLWDVITGELIGRPHEHPGQVLDVQFSADGMRAVSGSLISRLGDGAAQVFDGWTGEPLMAPVYHPRGASQLALSPNGIRLSVASRHFELSVWSLRVGALEPTRLRHRRSVWRAVFHQFGDRKCLVTQSFGGGTRRWDAATGELLASGKDYGLDTVAAHAAVGRDTLRQGLEARRELQRFLPSLLAPRYNTKQKCVQAAAATDDGTMLVTGCRHGTLRIYSLETGETVHPAFPHGEGAVTAVAIDAAGFRFASGGSKGEVCVWNMADGSLLHKVKLHDAAVTALAFSDDGKTIATGAEDGMTRFWWLEGDPELGPLMDNGNERAKRVNHLSFNPAGTILAVSGRSNAARLWDVQSGLPVGEEMPHIDSSTYGLFLLWSPDGERLVTAGSHDNTARSWRVSTSKMTTNPLLHTVAATSAALRPGGANLLFGARSARLWDLESGEPLTPLLPQDGGAYSSVFDDEGPRFATGTFGGSAYIWDFVDVTEPLPHALTFFAGALGGFWFNDEGVLERVPGDQFEARRADISELGAERNDSVGVWMRWLAEEPSEGRTISPYSKITRRDYIEGLVQQDSIDSLREVLLLRPGDPIVMGKLGYKLVSQKEPSERGKRFGTFLMKRAVWQGLKLGFGGDLRGRGR